MASDSLDEEKQAFEHSEGTLSSASGTDVSLNYIEGAPDGWSPVTTQWDDPTEKAIMRRIDWKLLPILALMYTVSMVDRTNMSNALIAGMGGELELMAGDRYSIALLVFFVPYFIFELPSNLMLRRVGAAKWLGGITLGWGLVMLGMGFVKDWQTLTVLRTLLGLFEAGFFPGCVYLISCWYVRYEVQKRLAAFFMVSIIGGGFSPLLASGLMQMKGLAGYRGWRWIFIIEGILTCIIAAFAYAFIIDFPEKVDTTSRNAFLTKAEIEIVKYRINRDRRDSGHDPITWGKVLRHLTDWKLWIFALLLMTAAMPLYAFAYFMPVILQQGMGYSVLMSQLLSAPPYFLAGIVSFGLAMAADKAQTRGPFIFGQATLTIIGLSLISYGGEHGVKYFGIFLGMIGTAANVPAMLTYQSNNIRTNSKRAVGSALQIGFGAIGGILASTTFRSQDRPAYLPGVWTALGLQFLALVLVTAMSAHFYVRNGQQSRGTVLEGVMGFRYTF